MPVGEYGWTEYQLRFTSDPSRRISGGLTMTTGGLWSGTQQTVNLSVVLRPTYRFRVSIGVNRTDADLGMPDSDFVTAVWTCFFPSPSLSDLWQPRQSSLPCFFMTALGMSPCRT